MGPNTLIDKSSFQSFTKEEAIVFECYFSYSLPSILLFEIIGDLKKFKDSDKRNENMVSSLSKRFLGSGPPICEEYFKIVSSELLGYKVPFTGQVLVQGGISFPSKYGGRGFLINMTSYNHAILRWADGNFTDEDEQLAKDWRTVIQNVDTASLEDVISKYLVIIPTCNNLDEVYRNVNNMINNSNLQRPLLDWFISKLNIKYVTMKSIIQRWRISKQSLPSYAPYTLHCIKALLMLLFAEKNELVPHKNTNLLDVQYLFYLPFCFIFVSDDRVQRNLSPYLLRSNQEFIAGLDLKKALREQRDMWQSLNSKEKYI